MNKLSKEELDVLTDKAQKWDKAVEWYGDMVNEYHGAVMNAGMFKEQLDEIRELLRNAPVPPEEIPDLIMKVITKYD